MSQFQLIPYNRIQDCFADQIQVPVSEGTIFNFNQQVFEALAGFEDQLRQRLSRAAVAHADGTGFNIGGKTHWLPCVTNTDWTLYYPHEKRGTEAFEALRVLPQFAGTLIRKLDASGLSRAQKPFAGYTAIYPPVENRV